MVDIRSVWASTNIRFRKLIGSRKSAVLLGCQLIFCYYVFIPMTQMTIAYGERIPPVAFVFYLSFYRMLVLHGAMTIFLFSDLLEPDSYSLWQTIRMGKKNYILGQIVYIYLISLIYMFVLFLFSLLMTLPVLGPVSEWGKMMFTMAENLGGMVETTGIMVSYSINTMILDAMTPMEALSCSMLLLWLTSSFVGITILFFTVFFRRSVGIMITGIMVSMTVFAMFAGLITIGRWLIYISPLSWSYIGLLDLYKSGNWPTIWYAVLVLLVGGLIMSGASVIRFGKCDVKGQ